MTEPSTPQPTGRGLNPVQLDYLLRPIDPNRVFETQGQSHLKAWDIRRHLNRFFGFGGWSYTTSAELVAEHRKDDHQKKNYKTGEPYGPKFTAWTVVYRAKVRLIVRDPHGNELAHFEEYAAGDAVNQPSLGDAHDMAMKTAESQALKRCAVNLGDQFGLSLYADGTTAATVQATLDRATPKPEQAAA
ncbi:Rad52/Rad22 family DNA repair protein [Streptomyces sp. NBC_01304]|uniref:Rad52/Rad22 family DNA repair protein n=1 Tax=Streptomyces sp. NBC_01304 TaxID=2903818 RepID=UPI002E0E9F21|nr:RAD52 family DNA repair protein [Streptomyces sp. NBC_01304]